MYTYTYSASNVVDPTEPTTAQPTTYVYAVKNKFKNEWLTSRKKNRRGCTNNLKDASLYGSKNGPTQLLCYMGVYKVDYEVVRYELKQV